ncbi:MAG: His-Xaa-Ser system radical SAM maturase HxsB [Nitrosomonadales bacterium]|nr:His-Xaa-Ser system radical SAM maturase HxsB [Nitrosomonadales bacterium]
MSNTHRYSFRTRKLSGTSTLAVSESGDHAFLSEDELKMLAATPQNMELNRLAELQSKFFVGNPSPQGSLRLLTSRISAKRETLTSGPSLYLIVLTLQCDHTCRYCQVSRSLESANHSIDQTTLALACDSIFESPSKSITVEFQGGDPLLRFDLLKFAIERISERNVVEKRQLRFVVASTLHQLNEEICDFFRQHQVYLSTSIDGPKELHNKNRPLLTRDSYERTVNGIRMARDLISQDAVSALMTTTLDSLAIPEAIIDEYVHLGFREIFLRQLSAYGFASRNSTSLSYSLNEFSDFYERAFNHILQLNRQGIDFREIMASIFLNKILSPFDAGFVDLQSPTGAGLAALTYNYDGFVYPSDEARMLAEMGDTSFRLGKIGEKLNVLRSSEVQHHLVRASINHLIPGCDQCAYNSYCGPDPISAKNQLGDTFAPVHLTEHCKRNMWLFDFLFAKLGQQEDWFLNLAYHWANPSPARECCSA